MTEAWLKGPVEGVPERLMPVAHSLLDALEELEEVADLDTEALWARPGGAASVGFHLRHVRGALDRLLTYARGNALDGPQLAFLRAEGEPGSPPATAEALVDDVRHAIEDAIDVLRATPEATLLEPRAVGRKQLPSNVQGLIFHAAEHTRRHAGQVIATARVVRAGLHGTGAPGSGPDAPDVRTDAPDTRTDVPDTRTDAPSSSGGAAVLSTEDLEAALAAWEDAGLRGLCGEGRLEVAADVLRSRGIPLR